MSRLPRSPRGFQEVPGHLAVGLVGPQRGVAGPAGACRYLSGRQQRGAAAGGRPGFPDPVGATPEDGFVLGFHPIEEGETFSGRRLHHLQSGRLFLVDGQSPPAKEPTLRVREARQLVEDFVHGHSLNVAGNGHDFNLRMWDCERVAQGPEMGTSLGKDFERNRGYELRGT